MFAFANSNMRANREYGIELLQEVFSTKLNSYHTLPQVCPHGSSPSCLCPTPIFGSLLLVWRL